MNRVSGASGTPERSGTPRAARYPQVPSRCRQLGVPLAPETLNISRGVPLLPRVPLAPETRAAFPRPRAFPLVGPTVGHPQTPELRDPPNLGGATSLDFQDFVTRVRIRAQVEGVLLKRGEVAPPFSPRRLK
jgi:hypothetical protein